MTPNFTEIPDPEKSNFGSSRSSMSEQDKVKELWHKYRKYVQMLNMFSFSVSEYKTFLPAFKRSKMKVSKFVNSC